MSKKLFVIPLIGVLALLIVQSCGKGEGFAPTTGVGSLSITPDAIIVPKSMTFKVTVKAYPLMGTDIEDVTRDAICNTNNSVASIDSSGNLSNTHTGTSVVRLNLTCTYQGLSVTAPVTIVPATLTSLILNKTNLTMGPSQNQNIKIYGNFTDGLGYVFALEMTNFVSWSSTNSSVSTAATNQVSSHGNGSANITASFGAIGVSTDVTVASSTPTPSSNPKGVGLLGSYYDFSTGVPWNSSTIGNPFESLFGQRIDSQVYFNWSTGTNNLGQPLYFGIRWTGRIYIPTTGSYTFYSTTDDGVRVWIDDLTAAPIIDNWTLHASTENTSAPVVLTGGQFYNIKMDYFENAGYSQAELRWSGPSIAKQLIPQRYLFPE
jgi:PA14 domain